MKKLIAVIILTLPVQFALADHHKVQNAVTADPGRYSVEFENDVIRVNCGDAVVHLPTNVGDADTEVIMVELKGRDKVE